MSSALSRKKCAPCESKSKPLDMAQIALMTTEVPEWRVVEGKRIERSFRFRDFAEAMRFVNQIATIAEEERHHPDFRVRYSLVDVTCWTHAISGLHENDFVIAAKIDALRN